MKPGSKKAAAAEKSRKGMSKKGESKTRKPATTKSRKQSPGNDRSKSKERANRTKERQKDDTVPFRSLPLRPNVYAKWSALSKNTEGFISKLLETNVTHAMNKSTKVDLETAQDTLNHLQAVLVRAVRGIKVPRPAVTNYKQLQSNTVILERRLEQNTDQIEILEEALEEEEQLTTTLEQGLRDLEDVASGSQTPTPRKQKVHPMLRASILDDLSVPDMTLLDEARTGRPTPDVGGRFDALTAQVAAISDRL